MLIQHINDLDDPRLAVYRSLKATNQTRGLNHFIVEGEKLVDRLVASRFPVRSILVTDRHLGRLSPMPPEGVPVYVVPFDLVHEIVGFPFHQGALACGGRLPQPDWRELWAGTDRPLTLAICPKLSNPENLGSIARLCDVFGVDGIVAGPSCPDPFSRRVLRVSMGSALRAPIIVSDDPLALSRELGEALGMSFWAAVANETGRPFDDLIAPRRLGLVLGDEDQGVDQAWVDRCDESITIPMRGGASSLNVSTAAAILLYHVTRRLEG